MIASKMYILGAFLMTFAASRGVLRICTHRLVFIGTYGWISVQCQDRILLQICRLIVVVWRGFLFVWSLCLITLVERPQLQDSKVKNSLFPDIFTNFQ